MLAGQASLIKSRALRTQNSCRLPTGIQRYPNQMISCPCDRVLDRVLDRAAAAVGTQQ